MERGSETEDDTTDLHAAHFARRGRRDSRSRPGSASGRPSRTGPPTSARAPTSPSGSGGRGPPTAGTACTRRRRSRPASGRRGRIGARRRPLPPPCASPSPRPRGCACRSDPGPASSAGRCAALTSTTRAVRSPSESSKLRPRSGGNAHDPEVGGRDRSRPERAAAICPVARGCPSISTGSSGSSPLRGSVLAAATSVTPLTLARPPQELVVERDAGRALLAGGQVRRDAHGERPLRAGSRGPPGSGPRGSG